jgi:long-chain acyl-CoA synthetase
MTERPWLKKYDLDVPKHIEYPDIPVQQLLLDSAERYPDHICLRCGEREYTYLETKQDVLALASSLQRIDVRDGDRLGLILPNVPEFVIAYYAALLIGAVVVPLNPSYTIQELTVQIQKTQISTIVGMRGQLEKLRQLKQLNSVKHLIVSAEKGFSETPELFENELNLEKLLHASGNIPEFPNINGSQAALFQFSGGTTGTPKAAVTKHKNIVANTLQFRHWLSTFEDGKEQFLTAIPLAHVYGMVIGLNVGIAMGATLNLIADPRDVNNILETIQRQKITFYPGVPAMFHAINENDQVKAGKYDLRSIKACISGSAPLLEVTRRRFERLTGGKLVEGYGLSEAPTATHCNPVMGENRNSSIGLPLPDVDCRIEPQSDSSNGAGELCIRGPQVMAGYYGDEFETKTAIVDGWLKTGDIARMDKDGYFYIVGRKKELIKIGGLQVWPGEVEAAIAKDPDVKEVVVSGVPDPIRGERVKAWVVVVDGCRENPERIMQICDNEIAYFKIPSEIEFIKEIPRTSVGKILRWKLVKQDMEK